VRRFVTQSFAAWPYARRGSWVKTEDDPLDDDPPAKVRRTLDAIRYLERATLDGPFDGLALRYGGFYGPGSGLDRTSPIADSVRRRRFPSSVRARGSGHSSTSPTRPRRPRSR
jgi:2-alkyl-3-oxoalkanoate reductase